MAIIRPTFFNRQEDVHLPNDDAKLDYLASLVDTYTALEGELKGAVSANFEQRVFKAGSDRGAPVTGYEGGIAVCSSLGTKVYESLANGIFVMHKVLGVQDSSSIESAENIVEQYFEHLASKGKIIPKKIAVDQLSNAFRSHGADYYALFFGKEPLEEFSETYSAVIARS